MKALWESIRLPLMIILMIVAFVMVGRAENAGYERRDQQLRTQHAEQIAQLERQWGQNVLAAQAESKQVRQELEKTERTSTERIKTLSAHLKAQEKTYLERRHDRAPNTQDPPEPGSLAAGSPDRPLLGAAVLDEHTVRLLDNARANRDDEGGGAAGRADEEVRAAAAAAPVTGTEFAENDLLVVKQYHQLATRHDRLVDWVNKQCVDPARQPTSP
jgi:hypothetical protein